MILEAVRPGVRLNSVQGFMNIDSFMQIRKEDGLSSPDILIDQITRGLDQMGKPYDFNFDVETLDKIVCSELIYIIFGNVHWPTKYRFGRATISPDDVAEIMFQKGTKFKMKTFMTSNTPTLFGVYSIDKIARELGFETRPNFEGYFKKSTKCYTTTGMISTRQCQTTYAQADYEER